MLAGAYLFGDVTMLQFQLQGQGVEVPSQSRVMLPYLATIVVLVLWGTPIAVLIVIAMLPWFTGLLVIGPVLGHASWHAYRGAVKA